MTDRAGANFAHSAWRLRPSGQRNPPRQRPDPALQWHSYLGPDSRLRAKAKRSQTRTGGIAWRKLPATKRRKCAHART